MAGMSRDALAALSREELVDLVAGPSGRRPSGAACARKAGHLGACSLRRNWYRSLSTSLVPPEGFGKLRKVAAFWKNPEKIWSNLAKIRNRNATCNSALLGGDHAGVLQVGVRAFRGPFAAVSTPQFQRTFRFCNAFRDLLIQFLTPFHFFHDFLQYE